MERLCERIRLNILHTQDGGMAVEVDGLLLNAQIRTPEVTRAAAQVAVLPQVRAWLLPIQQAFGQRRDISGIVAEGRDLGTKVFPNAPAKFFFKADAAERARRRHEELVTAGKAADLAQTRQDLDARDGRDRTPIIPSHEFSGVVVATGSGGTAPSVGVRVCGLVPFDRDGAAAEAS